MSSTIKYILLLNKRTSNRVKEDQYDFVCVCFPCIHIYLPLLLYMQATHSSIKGWNACVQWKRKQNKIQYIKLTPGHLSSGSCCSKSPNTNWEKTKYTTAIRYMRTGNLGPLETMQLWRHRSGPMEAGKSNIASDPLNGFWCGFHHWFPILIMLPGVSEIEPFIFYFKQNEKGNYSVYVYTAWREFCANSVNSAQ